MNVIRIQCGPAASLPLVWTGSTRVKWLRIWCEPESSKQWPHCAAGVNNRRPWSDDSSLHLQLPPPLPPRQTSRAQYAPNASRHKPRIWPLKSGRLAYGTTARGLTHPGCVTAMRSQHGAPYDFQLGATCQPLRLCHRKNAARDASTLPKDVRVYAGRIQCVAVSGIGQTRGRGLRVSRESCGRLVAHRIPRRFYCDGSRLGVDSLEP